MAKNEAKNELSLEEVQAQFADMLAKAKEEAKTEAAAIIEQAKAEAARIMDEVKASVKGDTSGMTAEEKARYDAYMNEEVEVKLFKDNDKYKEPVFVGCNGETIAIERGVRVKIKRKFALILDNSEHQDYEASLMMEAKSAEFAKSGL